MSAQQVICGLGLLLGALQIVGCSSGSSAREQVPHLADRFAASGDEAAAAVPAEDAVVFDEWWKGFEEPELDRFVAEALATNYDLVAAAARLEAAAAQARIAGAALSPQLSAGLNGLRAKRNFLNFPGALGTGDSEEGGGGGEPAAPRVLSTTGNQFGVSLDLSWELDLWGRVRAGKNAARSDAVAAAADLAAARHSIAAQTAKAWLLANEAAAQLKLAEETAENFAESARRVRARYENGLRSALDVRAAEGEKAGSEAALAVRRNALAAALRSLELLLGRYPSGSLALSGRFPSSPPAVPSGLPIQLLTRRADLVAAERRLEASMDRAVEARAALLPSITLTGSVGRDAASTSDLLDGNFGVWQIAGGLVQPLLQGGRLRANVDLVDARRAEAAAGFANTVLQAAAEVEGALFEEANLVTNQDALEAAAVESKAAARLALQRYLSGLEDYVTLLSLQRGSANAQARALEARRQVLENRVDLHLALGGGFDAEHLAAPADGLPEELAAPVAPTAKDI